MGARQSITVGLASSPYSQVSSPPCSLRTPCTSAAPAPFQLGPLRVLTVRGPAQHQPISIRDKSPFGVSINDVQIQKDTDVVLAHGCGLTVGDNDFRLRLEWEETSACHSLLSNQQVPAVAASCAALGIHVSKVWTDCVRLLVMHKLDMTPKLLLALIDKADIITPDYLMAVRTRVCLKDPMPDPACFRPPFADRFRSDLKPYVFGKGVARDSLLDNHVLVFLRGDSRASDLRHYKQVLERAKGTVRRDSPLRDDVRSERGVRELKCCVGRSQVEVWEAAQVVQQWPTYAARLAGQGKRCDCNHTSAVVCA